MSDRVEIADAPTSLPAARLASRKDVGDVKNPMMILIGLNDQSKVCEGNWLMFMRLMIFEALSSSLTIEVSISIDNVSIFREKDLRRFRFDEDEDRMF